MRSFLRKRTASVLVKSIIGAALLSGSSAFAVSVVPGSVCNVYVDPVTGAGSGGAVQYFFGSVAAGVGTGNLFTCPIPNGSTNGTSVRFRINVTDESSTDNVICQGLAKDFNTGITVLSSASVSSAGTFGPVTLDVTAAVPAGYSSADLVYFVECSVPAVAGFGLISSVNSIRID